MHVAPSLPPKAAARPDLAVSSGDARTAEILARSVYQDMKSYGLPRHPILQVASELIGLVTADLDRDTPPR